MATIARVVVVGSGPVGLALAGLLGHGATPVALVAGRDDDALAAATAVEVRMPDRVVRTGLEVHGDVASVGWRVGDLALLAVPRWQARAAVARLRRAAGADLPVASLVGGIRGDQLARAAFTTVLPALVWVAASRVDATTVRLFADSPRGVLDVGGGPQQAEPLCTLLRGAGLDARPHGDVRPWKVAAWMTDVGSVAAVLVDGDWPAVVTVARREAERLLVRLCIERVPMHLLAERVGRLSLGQVDGRVRGRASGWVRALDRSTDGAPTPGQPRVGAAAEAEVADLAAAVDLHAPVNEALAAMAVTGRRRPARALLSLAAPIDRHARIA